MAAAKHNDFPEVDHAAQERVADASTVARLVTFLQNAWYPKETQHAMRVDKKDTRVLSAPQGSRKGFRGYEEHHHRRAASHLEGHETNVSVFIVFLSALQKWYCILRQVVPRA